MRLTVHWMGGTGGTSLPSFYGKEAIIEWADKFMQRQSETLTLRMDVGNMLYALAEHTNSDFSGAVVIGTEQVSIRYTDYPQANRWDRIIMCDYATIDFGEDVEEEGEEAYVAATFHKYEFVKSSMTRNTKKYYDDFPKLLKAVIRRIDFLKAQR